MQPRTHTLIKEATAAVALDDAEWKRVQGGTSHTVVLLAEDTGPGIEADLEVWSRLTTEQGDVARHRLHTRSVTAADDGVAITVNVPTPVGELALVIPTYVKGRISAFSHSG